MNDPHPTPSDVELVGECLNGKTTAFEAIIDRYQKPIYNLCYRMTGSREEAADLSQEAFFNAFQNLSRYSPRQKFFSWLYTIALNLCRNHLRRKKILRWFSLDQGAEKEGRRPMEHAASTPSPEENLETKEKETLLKELIESLPPGQKSIMVLKFNDHLPDSEICAIAGISENNLRVQLHKAKKRLFEEYRKKFPPR